MPCHIVLWTLVIVAATVPPQPGEPAKQPKKALAGWPGIFPTIKGYQLTLNVADTHGDKKSPAYRQAANYEWSGGASRQVTVIVSRNADNKTKYSEEAIKKTAPTAKKIEVGKHVAWLVEVDKKDANKGATPLHSRLIVLLGDDRVVQFNQAGLGPFAETVQSFAEKFDFEKIKKALDNPPDTGMHRSVDAFRQLKKGMSYAEVSTWVGSAEKDIGSGIHIMAYTLDDGSRVMLGFPDFNKLMYVKHEGKDGKVVDLVD